MQTTKKAAGKKRKEEEAEGARVLTDTRERERERDPKLTKLLHASSFEGGTQAVEMRMGLSRCWGST